MDTTRVQRLLKLILQLQSGPPLNSDQLAKSLGVSRRTIYRDLKVLEAAGVPYDSKRGQGLTLAKSFYMPPLSLTVPEALGLMLLSKNAATQRERPYAGPALSAIYKLMATVPEPVRAACSEMMAHVSIDPTPAIEGDREADLYPEIQMGIDASKAIDLDYQPPLDPPLNNLRVHPYALHFAARAWYLFAYSTLHNEVRVFKLQRITQATLTTTTFHRPTDFTPRTKLRNAWQLNPSPEGTPDHDVKLRFTPKVATNVTETRWHPTQQHTLHPDGSATVTFTLSGLDEIAWWLCGYADQVTILDPPELRILVRDRLQRGADQHQ
ncbi:MAG: WYL domain-containing protein [Planctomycetota bacterium]